MEACKKDLKRSEKVFKIQKSAVQQELLDKDAKMQLNLVSKKQETLLVVH